MKSLVFKTAHQLRDQFTSWSKCLAYAWQLVKLKYRLLSGVAEFSFYKVDGSIRKAKGTLKSNYFNYEPKGQKPNHSTFTYFDLEKNSFRCFKIENLYLT